MASHGNFRTIRSEKKRRNVPVFSTKFSHKRFSIPLKMCSIERVLIFFLMFLQLKEI